MRRLFLLVGLVGLGCGGGDSIGDTSAGSSDAASDGDAREASPDSQADASTERSLFDASNVETALAAEASEGGDGEASTCQAWSYWNEGLSGGAVEVVQFDPRKPGVAFAVAGSQLYRSIDSGQTWTPASPSTPETITQLEFPAESPDVLLAATSGGFGRSEDKGKTWTTKSLDGVPLTALVVARTSPQRIVVGGDQGLIMRSNDGGSTWKSASSGTPFGLITSILGDATNPDNLVASVIKEDANGVVQRDGAILRSTNGANAWTTVFTVSGFVSHLSQCAANPKIIYASTDLGVSKSIDGGATWNPAGLTGTYATDVGIDAADCNHIYAAIFPSGIATSTDGGSNWSPPVIQGLTLQEGYQYSIELGVDPKGGANVIAATHGGVFRSASGGNSWTLATGIESVQCRDLRVSALAPQQLWMATWGSGVWKRPSPTAPWQRVPLDKLPREWIITVYPDSISSGRLLVGTFLGGSDAWRSTDNGATFNVTTGSSGNPFVFATDPTNPLIVYMGTQVAGMSKSVDGGATWQSSNAGATDAFVLSILIDSDDGHTIYMGTQNSGIFRSTDAGASWNPTTMGLGSGGVGSLVRFGSPSALYAWVDGAGVYRSQDGTTWTPSSAGLGALNSGGVVVDTVVPRLFAVAGSGVYTSADGSSWQQFDKGCPPPSGGSRPLIVGTGASRYLVFGGGSTGVLAHPL